METIETDYFITEEEHYRLALQSILRWSWRTDTLEPLEVVKAIRKVAKTALIEGE